MATPNLWGDIANIPPDALRGYQEEYIRDLRSNISFTNDTMINPSIMPRTTRLPISHDDNLTDAISYSLLASREYMKSELPKTVDEVHLIEQNEIDESGEYESSRVIGVCRSYSEVKDFLAKLKSRVGASARFIHSEGGLIYDNPVGGGQTTVASRIVKIGVPF